MTTLTAVKKPKEEHFLAVDFNLYLITDRHRIGERPFLGTVTEALKGGLKALQVREKDLGPRALLALAYALRKLTLQYDARLFINDSVDIAIAVDADGVHLGQKGIPPFAVRKISRKLIIGVSAHSLEEAVNAENHGADFITLGPVYPTPSKLKYGDPIGLETLRVVAENITIPLFAIGGIKPDNLKEVMDSGADGVAVISGIFSAKNIRTATGKYLRLLR